jgi:hypothetical protein
MTWNMVVREEKRWGLGIGLITVKINPFYLNGFGDATILFIVLPIFT